MKLIFISLLISFLADSHAIYVSVMEIYSSEKQTEIKIKVFSDDLQNALRYYSEQYRPAPLNQFIDLNENLITRYFNDKISLTINDSMVELDLTGWKLENDAHFLTFRGQSIRAWNEVKIRADYFMELFPDQSNIISVSYGNDKIMKRLTNSTKEAILKISR